MNPPVSTTQFKKEKITDNLKSSPIPLGVLVPDPVIPLLSPELLILNLFSVPKHFKIIL